jgi:hypothetical protein
MKIDDLDDSIKSLAALRFRILEGIAIAVENGAHCSPSDGLLRIEQLVTPDGQAWEIQWSCSLFGSENAYTRWQGLDLNSVAKKAFAEIDALIVKEEDYAQSQQIDLPTLDFEPCLLTKADVETLLDFREQLEYDFLTDVPQSLQPQIALRTNWILPGYKRYVEAVDIPKPAIILRLAAINSGQAWPSSFEDVVRLEGNTVQMALETFTPDRQRDLQRLIEKPSVLQQTPVTTLSH